jgi:hypothetical protein
MNSNSLKYLFTAAIFCISVTAYSQDPIGTEVINVVRPFTPTVADAFKIKETPVMIDSLNMEKKNVQYNIFSVPVASTFVPAKGKATTLERRRPDKLFDNYVTLGFGNYTTALGELYATFEVDRDSEVSLFFKHNSSQGGIKDVQLDDHYFDTTLDLNYSGNRREMQYNLGFGALHEIYNWYGLPEFATEDEIQIATDAGVNHSFYGVAVKGNLRMTDSPFSGGEVLLRYFGDSYSSSEINFIAAPEFLFNLGNQDVGINVDIDYLSGRFEKSFLFPEDEIKYSFLNVGVHPYIRFQNEGFVINLGAQAVFGMDNENSESDIFIYPKVDASFRVVDEFLSFYAGVDGGLDQNSYFNFTRENPYVSPTLMIAPTDRQYEGYAGIQGKFTSTVSYNLKGSYKNEINKPLFISNPLMITVPADELQGYEFGNSFAVVYDDVTTLEIFGELQAEVSTGINIGVNASFFSYSLDFLPEAFNLPEFKATVFANAVFNEQFFGGLSLFYVGERKDIESFDPFLPVEPVSRTLDGYLDANIHLGYNLNPQLTFFVRGSNLLSDNYEKWLNTPVQGIQVLGGATYKFNW